MRARLAVAVAVLAAAVPGVAAAQGSIFALRGLGWAGRPVTARTAATGGALAMFDPSMSANPAALSRWRSVAAWAVAAPTRRTFTSSTVSATQQTVRFPLFGFVAVMPPRVVLGFSISDYLDRTWTLTQTDSLVIRGQSETFTDAGRSIGGISDLQVAGSYRLSPAVSAGLGFHYYLGSTRLTAQRVYVNPAYQEVIEQAQTDFRAAGVGAGVLVTLGRVDVAASARLNGRLRSQNSSGTIAHTGLPNQIGLGLRWQAVPGVYVAGSAQYDSWARAEASLGAGTAKNVWSFGAGGEVVSVSVFGIRTPLRLGYRSRTLPFPAVTGTITEWGASGGVGLNLARERTTIDFAFETGRRSAGPSRETFKSIFVGLTVRP